MSNVLVGLLFGLGFGAWVYGKIARSTGGNTQNALIVAGVAAAFGWVTVTVVLGMIA